MNSIFYFGMDVHTKSFTVAVYERPFNSDGILYGTHEIQPTATEVKKLVEKYKERYKNLDLQIVCGYEAGCLGFSLQRELKLLGITCVILAPTTMAVSRSDMNVKTDKRDSLMIAKCLAEHNYKAVYVPNQKDEAVAAYIRMRDDAVKRAKQIKQQISGFCHREGHHYKEGSTWTAAHFKWLQGLTFENEIFRLTLDEYLIDLNHVLDRIKAFDAKIAEYAEEKTYKENCGKLGCFLGMSTTNVMAILSEIGDFSRFENAHSFASYLGLTPGQHSSSESTRYRGITKAGNIHLRRLLVESSQGICRGKIGVKGKTLLKRQSGQDSSVIAYADKANYRLRKKYYRMIYKGKSRNVAVVAVARELASFIWGMVTGHYDMAVKKKVA